MAAFLQSGRKQAVGAYYRFRLLPAIPLWYSAGHLSLATATAFTDFLRSCKGITDDTLLSYVEQSPSSPACQCRQGVTHTVHESTSR
jgi:hypothetical protein